MPGVKQPPLPELSSDFRAESRLLKGCDMVCGGFDVGSPWLILVQRVGEASRQGGWSAVGGYRADRRSGRPVVLPPAQGRIFRYGASPAIALSSKISGDPQLTSETRSPDPVLTLSRADDGMPRPAV
jgi:hypothetical protein